MSGQYTTGTQVKQDPLLSKIPVLTYEPSDDHEDLSTSTLIEVVPEVPRYEPHTFIGWQFEYAKYFNLRDLFSRNASGLKRLENHSVRWLTLIVSCVATAFATLIIDYFSMLLHDLKYGTCTDRWYNVKLQCYPKWKDWGTVVTRGSGSVFQYFVDFFVLLVSAILFAIIAFKIVSHDSSTFTNHSMAQLKMVVAGLHLPGFLNFGSVVRKVLSLLFVISSGLWMGYDGPLVHVSSALLKATLDLFSRFGLGFQNAAIRREVLSSGFSIGIASAFNAPIGGVIFGLEQIQSYFAADKLMWNSFICTTIGVTVMQQLNPFKDVSINESFKADFKNNWLYFEAAFYVLLGVVCGGLGILFNKLNIRFDRFRKRAIGDSVQMQFAEVLALTVATNLLAYFFAASRFNMNEVLDYLLTDCADNPFSPLCRFDSDDDHFPFKSLALLFLFATEAYLLSAYTYGVGLPGGVLIPALVIGALVGRFLGVLVEFLQYRFSESSVFLRCYNEKSSCISVASYAVVGAASFFGAVTKMSVAPVVIISELTGAINYIIPIMMGVFCAKVINDIFLGKSIYEMRLISKGEQYFPSDLEDTMTISELVTMNTSQMMKSAESVQSLYDDGSVTVTDLDQLPKSSDYGHPILLSRSDPQLVGYLTSYQIKEELAYARSNRQISADDPVHFTTAGSGFSLRHAVTPMADLFVASPTFSLLSAYEVMDKLKLTNLFICLTGNNTFRGMISRHDMVLLLHSEDKKLDDGLRGGDLAGPF